MFIAIKDTKVIAIHELDWQCRRRAKGLDKSDYWTWLESVTTEGIPDYSGEDYEIVETDAPYLAPVPLRGKSNEPSYIVHTVKFLSELKKISFDELSKTTTKNFFNLFGDLN